jgi:hypothetical protein
VSASSDRRRSAGAGPGFKDQVHSATHTPNRSSNKTSTLSENTARPDFKAQVNHREPVPLRGAIPVVIDDKSCNNNESARISRHHDGDEQEFVGAALIQARVVDAEELRRVFAQHMRLSWYGMSL